jgi:hypothetical protein
MEGRFLSMILVGNREEIARVKKIEAEAAKAEAAAQAAAAPQATPSAGETHA